ncbi:MAG: BON domain-containing protein [Sphingobacteriales bacterium]|nr:BON domain-containing protein [Sphingobacteriales bacterium]OJV99527.1 MAG: ornithine aminotransferase [Sphingobacteriales bacterium 44-61]
MKSDATIQKEVQDELKWQPLLNATEIGVAVKNGIVTLSGQVDSYTKKLAAEKAAKRIGGVKAVAEDIKVAYYGNRVKTDAEIAEAVVNALKWHSAVQEEKIKIKVDDGVVTLDGEVDWDYQRTNAKTAIENLTGVKLVVNLIGVKPKVKSSDVTQGIKDALLRSANSDAGRIRVDVIGSKVILSGFVRSFAEKEDAETAAWAAPGVITLESNLVVAEPEFSMID